MDRSEPAAERFARGYNCAQTVFYRFSDDLGIQRDLALRVAAGFGGGMGRKQEVCGALSGGIMALSLRYGKGEQDTETGNDLLYLKVREFIDEFEKRFGSSNCKVLLSGCNLLTETGQKQFKDLELIEQCCNYVEIASEIVEKLLQEEN